MFEGKFLQMSGLVGKLTTSFQILVQCHIYFMCSNRDKKRLFSNGAYRIF